MDELIKRINELAKKKKSAGLTKEEAEEQIELRQQYLDKFREGFKQRLENIDVETPDGKVRPLTEFKKNGRRSRLHTPRQTTVSICVSRFRRTA